MKRSKQFLLPIASVLVLVCLFAMPTEVNAASESDLTFTLNEDGESYSLTGCDSSAAGELMIPAVYNGKPVTSIGYRAFYGCTGLTEIVIPDSVTSIGDFAFFECSKLTGIWVNENNNIYCSDSNGVLYSKDKTILFQAPCRIAGTYIIPDSVISVGDFAFYKCAGLSYNVYANAKYLGNSRNPYFVLVEAKYSETIPYAIHENTAFIHSLAFYNQANLKEITIPDSVTSIGHEAFSRCYGLESVTLGNNLVNIGEAAFLSCHNLTEIIIPESVNNIGRNAFQYCEKLTKVTIPNSVTCIGEEAFLGCTNLMEIKISDNVNRIAYSSFYDCKSLISIFIGNGVTEIDALAFHGCDSLTDVYYGGLQAQWNGIVVGEGNDPLLNANLHCIVSSGTCGENLTWTLDTEGTLTISGIGRMADYTYEDEAPWNVYADQIQKVVIESGCQSIGKMAFINCPNVAEVIIPEGVEEICSDAFKGCSLKSVVIPDSVKKIGKAAFYGNYDLVSLDLGEGLTFIDEGAFWWCSSLKEVTIPDSVTYVGVYAFSRCRQLERVALGKNVQQLDVGVFNECWALKYVNIPEGVTEIKNHTFFECTNIASLTIPASVTAINKIAFIGWTEEQIIYYEGTQNKWDEMMAASPDAKFNATVVCKANYGQKVLALGADLSMDFYVAVSEAVATDENAKMQISLGGKVIDEIALKDAKQVEVDDEWYCWYVFTAEVPVKDITKEISLQLTDSTGNVGDAYTYTVKQYADYLLANSTDEKVLNICQALLDYGAAAEKHFTVRAGGTVADSELANGGDFGTRLDGVTVEDTYKPTKTADITGITCYGTSLILEADTSIRLYFMTDAETWSNVEVAVDVVGAEYNVSQVTNGKAYIEITGIHAADLDTGYTVTITSGTESITIHYGGLSYAWVVMNSSPSGTLANMVKAMYKYWEAAESYNQLPPPEPGDDEFEILPF